MSVCLLMVLAAIIYWAANLYGHRAARLSYDRLLAGAALQVAESIRLNDGDVVIDLPRAAFETLELAPEDRVFYAIELVDGPLLTGYSGLPESIEGLPVNPEKVFEGQLPISLFDAPYSGEMIRFIVLERVLKDVGVAQAVRVKIGQTLRARHALAADISWRATQFVALFIVIALVLIMCGIWMLLSPLRNLNLALSRRSPVDLSPLEVNVPQEIEPLLQTINHFMLQLSITLDRLKRFTGEAAHQIRTPLAGLKSQAQNALEEQNATLRQEQLKRVVECSDMLASTVSQMLNQAKLAHRFQSEMFGELRLDELVMEVCREVAVGALNNGVEVAYLGDCKVVVQGDGFALKQMIRNILENAIKYSPQAGVVEVNFDGRPGTAGVKLTVSDQGPGIPVEERNHVFEQFYRSPNNPRAGSGLGLAIAREVAVHHHAQLKLIDNIPNGLVVEIYFSRGQVL